MFDATISQHLSVIIVALTGALFVFLLVIIFLAIRYRQMSKTLAYLTRGAKAASLEQVITSRVFLARLMRSMFAWRMSAQHSRKAFFIRALYATIHLKTLVVTKVSQLHFLMVMQTAS